MDIKAEKQYQYWLMNAAGAGGRTKRRLLQEFGNAKAVYEASTKELETFLRPKQAKGILESRESWNILTEYEKFLQRKIKFTCYGDEDYPERLLSVPDAPFVLYYEGHLPLDLLPSVAIIGARACSEYGSLVAKEFGSKLAAAGIQIISGLAVGIDGISQEAALSAGGESFGVLGCGVNICYPKNNRFLYERLKKQGGILSEYAPDTQPAAGLFPPRNRIISGLADIVLVVEAKEKSGTFITVDMALEQGREVFAVPGRVTDLLSRGCLKLLHQGAGMAVCPEDIIEALYGIGRIKENGTDALTEETAESRGQDINPVNIEEKGSFLSLTNQEKQVFSHLAALSKMPEEIYAEFGGAFTIQEIMGILVELCIKGLAEQGAEGGYHQKNSCILKKIGV